MKRFIPATLVLVLAACGAKESANSAPAAETAVTTTATANPAPLNLDQIPVSTKDLGPFPFFTLPNGFSASSTKDQELETKYVFPDGALQVIEGRYHHVRVQSSKDAWNETLLLRSFDDKVRELGGVRIFDGSLPDSAREKIAKDEPRFVADLYDPSPYRFRQYLIRTPQGRVWIEIGYGYNAPMADLTIVQDKVVPEAPKT